MNLGENAGSYIVATTSEKDAKPGFPAGAINGGFYHVSPELPKHYPSFVIGVEDIKETIDKINQHGGQVQGEASEIPNYGIYVSFLDTEGNRNSIIQPTGM